MKTMIQDAQALQADLVAWRRTLHQAPETGMELPGTVAFVRRQLEQMGYRPQALAGGLVAVAGGHRPGRCILLRADMDALPVTEQTQESFRSPNGAMHACGHDFHTAMLLGAAKLLRARENEIPGTVKLMFQPGEETLQGAKAMIEAGVLQHPAVDAAAMLHVATGAPVPSGTILVPGEGAFSSASDRFEIAVQGKGGHGAMPEHTVDPLNVMSHLHLALQAICSREVPPGETAVVTVCSMQGGETYNVIPDTAQMKGTVRTYNPAVREFVLQRISEISRAVAETFRAKAAPRMLSGCPSVMVDLQVAQDIHQSLQAAFGSAVPKQLTQQSRLGSSEDFSFVTAEVPSVMLLLSAGSTEEGYTFPLHHPQARFNEEVISQGAAAYVVAALGWLEKNPPAASRSQP